MPYEYEPDYTLWDRDNDENWQLIDVPLLEGGSKSYKYKQQWSIYPDNRENAVVGLIMKDAEQRNKYPHLIVELNPKIGAIAEWHYSESRRGQRFGSREIKDLLKILLPFLISDLSTDYLLSVLSKHQ